MASQLLEFTRKSIYCPQADVHIDPWKPVRYAIITHAHSDHARWGNEHYLAHKDSEAILRYRLGPDIALQTVEYGESFTINGVRFSLHPAGHMIGSAQVRVESKGEVWVASGDYKLEADGFAKPFELVKCHAFITESTFGLPIYKWKPQEHVFTEIADWISRNKDEGKASILMGYTLGKMQRILSNLQIAEPVFAHGAVFNMNERLREAGFKLPALTLITRETDKKLIRRSLILAPTFSAGSTWIRKFAPYSLGYCSGWMMIRGAKNRRAIDQGFTLSDHADWNDLNSTVRATGAEKVYVTHGFTSAFSRWLNECGIYAEEVKTRYGDDEEQDVEIKEDPSSQAKAG